MGNLNFEEALTYKLINTAAISAIAGTRCHPLRLPDTATLPAITYQEISAPRITTHDETPSTALTRARYQITAWATTYPIVRSLATEIFKALHGFKGIITKGADTCNVQCVLAENELPNYDSETSLYWTSQDFIVWF